jgi:hypothetical protein
LAQKGLELVAWADPELGRTKNHKLSFDFLSGLWPGYRSGGVSSGTLICFPDWPVNGHRRVQSDAEVKRRVLYLPVEKMALRSRATD